jgi:uroporphyrinogen-III synthase
MKVKSILVSQPKPSDLEKSPYTSLGQKYNIKIDYEKFIKVVGVEAREFRKSRINLLDHSAVIMTSKESVNHYFRLAEDLRVEIPDAMKYFCVSESIAYYLQKYVQYRKRKIFHGQHHFNDLIDVMKKHKDEKFLLPCSDIQKQDISRKLKDAKLDFTKAVMYRTMASDLSELDIHSYDLLVFFSPSGVKSLFKNFPDFEQNSTLVAAFGPTTARAVRESGLKLNIGAPTKSAPSMTMAIEEFISKNNKKR